MERKQEETEGAGAHMEAWVEVRGEIPLDLYNSLVKNLMEVLILSWLQVSFFIKCFIQAQQMFQTGEKPLLPPSGHTWNNKLLYPIYYYYTCIYGLTKITITVLMILYIIRYFELLFLWK